MWLWALAGLVSFLVAFSLTPLVRRFSLRYGFVAVPGARSAHTTPTPVLGGLAIAAGFVLPVFVFLHPFSRDLAGLIAGGLVMLAVGLIDDIYDLPPLAKLAGQFLAAGVLVAFGVKVDFLRNPFGPGYVFLSPVVGVVFTLLWVVSMANVANIMDGLDGLSAGISSIAALTLLFVAIETGNAGVAILTALLAGSALGFLPHNFNPAKIFMGDTGALFLGYTLAAVSVLGALKTATALALVVPAMAMGLPIFDTAFAIVRRLANHSSVAQADRNHLHHRLLDIGLSQRQVVVLMYLVSALLGVSALAVTVVPPGRAFVGVLLVVLVLAAGGARLGLFAIRREHGVGQ